MKWKFTANISSLKINYTMNTVTIDYRGNLIIESVLDVDQFNPFQRRYFFLAKYKYLSCNNISIIAAMKSSRHAYLCLLVQALNLHLSGSDIHAAFSSLSLFSLPPFGSIRSSRSGNLHLCVTQSSTFWLKYTSSLLSSALSKQYKPSLKLKLNK